MKELFEGQHALLSGLLAGDSFKASAKAAKAVADLSDAAAPVGTSDDASGSPLATFVEVGCGSSEAAACLLRATPGVAYVGLDLAQGFLDMSRTLLHKVASSSGSFALLYGNALELEQVMKTAATVDESADGGVPASESAVVASALERPSLVGCLMNSMGIFSPADRREVVKGMIRVAGSGGVVLLGCWAAAQFHRGVEEFYKKHPAMCGTITDDMVDLEAATLLNPDGPGGAYSSHWWTPEQLLELFPESLRSSVEIATAGVGIFAILRITEVELATAE
jgi:SAM-dependent methyltransferase